MYSRVLRPFAVFLFTYTKRKGCTRLVRERRARAVNEKSPICSAMKRLQYEQKVIASYDKSFQFICQKNELDTIPFMLYLAGLHQPFMARSNCITTPFFRLEELHEELCCAVLSLVIPIDMDGFPAESYGDFYALRKSTSCITVNLNCFCAITPLPPSLVNRPLPIIEPKK